MSMQPPKIDSRTSEVIVDRVKTLVQRYTPWLPAPPAGQGDAAEAFMRIFGRLTELIIERLNQTPEKNFLAFLDLIGTQIQPPQPARVPLTFQLAAGSPADARVPIRTQVAAPATEGETAEVLYETDQELIVTTSRLVAVFARNPDTDRYGNYTWQATDDSDSAFAAFQGDQPIEHSLYLGRDDFFTLPAPKSARLTIDSPDAVRLAALPVVWSYSDGATWHVLTTIQSALPAAERWEVTIANLPAPAITDRNGLQAGWLRAHLDIPLPRGDYDADKHTIRRSGLPPDMAVIAGKPVVDLSRPFSPFNQSGVGGAFFYLRVDEAFVRAGATVRLTISLAQSGRPPVTCCSDGAIRMVATGNRWANHGRPMPPRVRLHLLLPMRRWPSPKMVPANLSCPQTGGHNRCLTR